jgi:signal transduction histidine kinase
MGSIISKKAMVLRAVASIVAMALTTTTCIFWTFFRVQTDIVKSNVENMIAAVESGPLEFAHLHSASVANQQLEKLMNSVIKLNLGYRSAEIKSGDNFSETFAAWRFANSESVEIEQCLYSASKIYDNPSYLYPFKVELSVDICEGFPLVKSLQYSILAILIVSFAIISLSPLSILLPIGSSISVMENIIRKRLGAEKLEMIRYEPLQSIAKLAIQVQDSEREAAVGRITAQISHDLRAPLGAFERLLHLDPTLTIDSQKDSIRQSLLRLNSMIESLRHTEVELLIERSCCDLSFERGVKEMRFKAQNSGVILHTPSLEQIKVYIDEIKFERAWGNLVSNAIDAANSWVQIDVEISGQILILRVIDDGAGVPERILSKLFERGATSGKSGGTGLGLAYVRQIMRGHGGDVTYRRENNLTVFECRLPNAVLAEKEQVVENTKSLEIKLEQKLVRTVAIYLEPETLSQSILAKLASYKSDDFFFTRECEGANIVVSNIEDIMFEVLERDDQEFVGVANLKGDERAIATVLTRKFNLEPEGKIRV